MRGTPGSENTITQAEHLDALLPFQQRTIPLQRIASGIVGTQNAAFQSLLYLETPSCTLIAGSKPRRCFTLANDRLYVRLSGSSGIMCTTTFGMTSMMYRASCLIW